MTTLSAHRLTRRRFIAVTAAAGSAAMLPQALEGRTLPTATWRGIALGADASLILQHSDATAAKAAIHACLEEVARLEAIFSLHRPDSALARLNADGVIDDAPADLRLLLAEALAIAARSGGAFDPTVQPLWDLYARHFSRADAAADGPAPDVIEARRRLVDWRKVAMDGATIRLREAGMAVTLNGIAQGYITDKVGDLLRGRGFRHVLVNMGEPLALGPKWDGKAWRVAIADPRAPDRTIGELELTGGAVATSGGYGCHFDAEGRFSHLLDPQSGAPARQWASVTVISDRASLADALSTALSVMPEAAWGSVLGPELSLSRPRPDCLVFRLSPAGSPGRGPVWG